MRRVSIGIAVILLAALSGVGAKVEANGAEKASPPAAGPVPACLKPVPMDEPDAPDRRTSQSIFRSTAPSTRPTLFPRNSRGATATPPPRSGASRFSSAKRLDRFRSGQPARRCKSAPSMKP